MPWELQPLWNPCDLDDKGRVEELIKAIDRPIDDLFLEWSLSEAVEHYHLFMVRYLLDRGGFLVDRMLLQRLVRGRSLFLCLKFLESPVGE
jgi:hypothetical protein